MLMKKQTMTRLTTTTTMEGRGSRRSSGATPRPQLHQQQQQQQLVTSSSSSSYQSPEYIRRQYQERQKIVENDVLQEELLMRELEAKLARLQKPSTTSLAATSQAAIMPPSEQAAGHMQSTALVLKPKTPTLISVTTDVAPVARRPDDRDDHSHPMSIPALLPMHVPLQSLSILQVGRLLQHHNLMPYIDSFARNCVDGETLAETTLSHDDLQELGMHIRLHRVRLLKVVQKATQNGVPPAVLYRSREENFSSFHDDDDDDDDDDSGNENNSVDASSIEALDAAIAGRESVASFLSLMGGEEKEGGIVGQEAAT